MNIASLNKPKLIKAVITAFFVLVAVAATLEPLYSLTQKTAQLPPNTRKFLVRAPGPKIAPDFFDGVIKTVPPTHDWAGNVALLEALKEKLFSQPVESIAVQDFSLKMNVRANSEVLFASVLNFLARQTPFEIKTRLPDQTSMIEIVIDPQLVPVSQSKTEPEIKTFTGINPQLSFEKNGSNSIVSFGYPQAVEKASYLKITSCHTAPNGVKTITFGESKNGLTIAMLANFSAYLKDFSCFQSFSTFSSL